MKINLGFIVSKFLRWINRPALRNCKIDNTSRIGTGSNCIELTMGRYSYMGKNNSVTNASIGSFCSIASYCAIGGGAHEKSLISTSPVFVTGKNILGVNFSYFKPNINRPVIIGNDVWIGENVFIMDGISIGNGVIIGAHSVVTHDIPSYAIVAGAPARIIRFRFKPEDINFLENSQWWNLSKEELKTIACYFSSIELLKEKLSPLNNANSIGI